MSAMSFRSKRELLSQVAPRYREARHGQKTVILNEFLASTGYARKYAIRLLAKPMRSTSTIKRPRPRRYGYEVQEALATAWAAANQICAKRLVPFLPELVQSLERHGHLALAEDVRDQLLAISPATADRILRVRRQSDGPRGLATTKHGLLLKHLVPVRTFSDWCDVKPGFFEGDLVAHCGTSAYGAYLYSFVLTDVATGWTECLPLRFRSQEAVIQSLDVVRQLLPFAVLGFDTDNGSEFLNNGIIAYCERAQITFTRGRAYKKNDQCFVEQKNGSIVRQLVGYDRYEGEIAYRQLTELYRAVRLYINFFQPSVKLQIKHRDGSKVQRTYDTAKTPYQRLLNSNILQEDVREHLSRVYRALDPVRLLQQLQALQDALWRQAVRGPFGSNDPGREAVPAMHFDPTACVSSDKLVVQGDEVDCKPTGGEMDIDHRGRKYHRAKRSLGPRTYRTRQDPFEAVNDELHERFLAAPELTAKMLLTELQQRQPAEYPDRLLRTLQRRVNEWRKRTILAFDDRLVTEDLIVGQSLPVPLRAVTASASHTEQVVIPGAGR
jgi:hypothetical protein